MEQHTDLLSIARKVRVAGKELKKRRDRNAKVHGMTSNQADALTFIRDNPGCSITALKNCISTSHQAACGLADRLVTKGLVEFGTSDDARVKTLALTPEGAEMLQTFYSVGVEDSMELFGNLSEEEILILDRIMDKILERMDVRRDPGGTL